MNRRTAGAQSRKAGEAWEEYVSARWLTPALRAGMIRRFDKLTIFLLGKESSKIDPEDRDLLIEQREHMVPYLRTLNKRIDRF